MPKARLTREESQAKTRADLLRAANRLFLRDGFVTTSLSAIAEEAGVTKGAVYSNFESKEDLFLALLQASGDEAVEPAAVVEGYAPTNIDSVEGSGPKERAASFGRYVARLRPSRKHVALFLETNAFALRNARARTWVAARHRPFFEDLGRRLGQAIGRPDADPAVLGLVAQSLYVGLFMHRAFAPDEIDDQTFAKAYELLASL